MKPCAFDAADQIGGGHGDVVEEDFAGVDAFVAQFVEIAADGGTAIALLDGEHADAGVGGIGVGIRLGGNGEHRAVARVGDEHFRAGEDVVVAAADRGRANRLHIAAGVRLGQCEAAAFFAARHRGQEIFFLRVGAVIGDDVGHDEMAVDDAGEGHPSARQLFHHARVGEEAEAEAAEVRGDGGAEEAEFAHRGDHRVRILVAMLEGGGVGDDVALDEAADGGDDFAI